MKNTVQHGLLGKTALSHIKDIARVERETVSSVIGEAKTWLALADEAIQDGCILEGRNMIQYVQLLLK